MTDGVILDGLLLTAVLLYVPIGALRGGLREAILGGAILLGGLLAVTRPDSWTRRVASITETSPEDASFLVAAACLGGAAVLLGFGGGALYDRRLPSWRGRILGAGLGGANAAVFLALILIAYEDLARSGERSGAIARSYAAGALIDHIDLLVLAVAGLAIAATAGGHLTHRLIGVPYDTDLEPALTWLQGTQRPARPIRIPAEADSGKVEPDLPATPVDAFDAVIRTSRAVRPETPPSVRAARESDGWADLPWHDDHALDPEPPQPTGGRTMEQPQRRWDEPTSRHVPAADGGRAYDASLAELHRLLRIAPALERRDVPPPSSGFAPDPRSDERLTGEPVEPERCPRCDSHLPDPALPCPFCDHRR